MTIRRTNQKFIIYVDQKYLVYKFGLKLRLIKYFINGRKAFFSGNLCNELERGTKVFFIGSYFLAEKYRRSWKYFFDSQIEEINLYRFQAGE